MMRTRIKLNPLPPKSSSPTAAAPVPQDGGGGGGGGESVKVDLEMRPCGMLVQKRSDSDQNSVPPPTIRLRVKYGSIYHEIYIISQATFGELKKKLQGVTGLHHQDQKLFYKKKERDSSAYLDIVGVKDKSKIVLIEDPISQEKRYLEMRKNAKMEKAAKSISEISLEVDRLSGQVSALEAVVSKGGKVAEKEVLNLTELLMNELIKLDAIMVADGDVKLQRKMQVRRVQKYVETLDVLKVKNSMTTSNGSQVLDQNQQKQTNGHTSSEHISDGNSSNGDTSNVYSSNGQSSNNGDTSNGQPSNNGDTSNVYSSNNGDTSNVYSSNGQSSNGYISNGHTSKGDSSNRQSSDGHILPSIPEQKPRHSVGHSVSSRPPWLPQPQQVQEARRSTSSTVVTTQWETFDSGPPLNPISFSEPPLIPPSPTLASSSASTSAANTRNHRQLNWEFFE